MSYTTKLQIWLVFLIFILLTFSFLSPFTANVSGASDRPLTVELENELSFEPTEQKLISDYDSEIAFSYEPGVFEIETSSEFEIDGLSEVELLLGIEKDPFEAESELAFDPEKTKLVSYELAGDIQLDPNTAFEIEYESDYPEKGETAVPELMLTIDRELTKELSIEIEGEYSEPERPLNPVPNETEVDLSGLEGRNFALDTELEFEKKELEEIEFDFERSDSSFGKSGLNLEASISWELSEDSVEFEPELELEFGELSLETILYLGDKTQIRKLEILEASLDDLELAGWNLEFSTDFESEESEITLERDHENPEVEFEFEIRANENDNLFNLGEMTGELDWKPEEYLAVTIEAEPGLSSPPEFSLSTEYEF